LPGDIRAIVSSDIYSEDGSNVLIQKGTRLIGEYKSGIQPGQERVYVIWSTAITPEGYQVPLASRGTNALGVAGLSGDYDSHFMKRFGAALLLSVIESQDNNDNQLNLSAQNSLSNASSVALNHSINIPPTIYVDQGEKINIFVARNILF
jgi:type IV secretion system protein VirB10